MNEFVNMFCWAAIVLGLFVLKESQKTAMVLLSCVAVATAVLTIIGA